MSLYKEGIWFAVASHKNPPNRILSPFETAWVGPFYAPAAIWGLLLSIRYMSPTLPTLANTAFPMGGFLTSPKSQILDELGPMGQAAMARYVIFDFDVEADKDETVAMALAKMDAANIVFPVVAKPDVGRNGVGVKKVADAEALAGYIAGYPENTVIMLQEFSPFKGEAGIFYVRHPDKENGWITSLTTKFFPSVTGDGKSTLRQLIMADERAGRVPHYYFPTFKGRLEEVPEEGVNVQLVFTGNHRRGAVFCDASPHITDAMTEKFDAMSKEIDGFYFGRFDVRFKDIESFKRGEDFTIIEVNGAGSEAIHIWDANMTLLGAYRALFAQYLTAFQIGAVIRKRGARPVPTFTIIRRYLSEIRSLNLIKKSRLRR